MRKGIAIGLIVVVLILGSLYYYFFIHTHNVRTQKFLDIVDSFTKGMENFGGQVLSGINDSDLDYYRYACKDIDYEYFGFLENEILLKNMNCDWNKVRELLSEVPEEDNKTQYLYFILSEKNAMRVLYKSFNEKVKYIHSQKGFTFGVDPEILTNLVLVWSSGHSWTYVAGEMNSVCSKYHNNSLLCMPVLFDAESKANKDLIREIDFGENFISGCMQSKVLSIVQLPNEIKNVQLNRDNCGRIAEIYQLVFDDVRDEEMDENGKFFVLNTLYITSNVFKGKQVLEAMCELNNIMKKYVDPEFSDVFEWERCGS